MNFTVKQRTTNVRPSKTEEAEVSTTPTQGIFKINAQGALAVGLKSHDYIDVVVADMGNGDEIFIAKGKAPVKNENGKTIESAIGARLASPNNKMSGTLQASSANTYQALEGNAESNRVYSIDVENPQTDENGTSYFRLVFARKEEKQTKSKKEA